MGDLFTEAGPNIDADGVSLEMARYLVTILNDPDMYSEAVYKFFNCHQIFQMIPHVSAFISLNQALLSTGHQLKSQNLSVRQRDLECIEEESKLESDNQSKKVRALPEQSASIRQRKNN